MKSLKRLNSNFNGFTLLELALVALLLSIALLPILQMKGAQTANTDFVSIASSNKYNRRLAEAAVSVLSLVAAKDPSVGLDWARLPKGYANTYNCSHLTPGGCGGLPPDSLCTSTGCKYVNGSFNSPFKLFILETTYRRGSSLSQFVDEKGNVSSVPGPSNQLLPIGFRSFQISIQLQDPAHPNTPAYTLIANVPIRTGESINPNFGKVGVEFVADVSGSMQRNDVFPSGCCYAGGAYWSIGPVSAWTGSPFLKNRYAIDGATVSTAPGVRLNPWDDAQLDLVYGSLSDDPLTPYDDRYPAANVLGLMAYCSPYNYRADGVTPNPSLTSIPRMSDFFLDSALGGNPTINSMLPPQDPIYHLCLTKQATYSPGVPGSNYSLLPYLRSGTNPSYTYLMPFTGGTRTNDDLLNQKMSRIEAMRSALLASLVQLENTPIVINNDVLEMGLMTFGYASAVSEKSPLLAPVLGSTLSEGGTPPDPNHRYFADLRKRMLSINRVGSMQPISADGNTATAPSIAYAAQLLCNKGETYSDKVILFLTDGEPTEDRNSGFSNNYPGSLPAGTFATNPDLEPNLKIKRIYSLVKALADGKFMSVYSPTLSDGAPNPGYYPEYGLPNTAPGGNCSSLSNPKFKLYTASMLMGPTTQGGVFLTNVASKAGTTPFFANTVTAMRPMFDALVYNIILAVQQAQFKRAYQPPA
ncbi:MAG: hypothetical protein K2X01_10245 [Cyanobacteria bacterium]|nr:hypothetical protein [Cyanobacteriota bacterium]